MYYLLILNEISPVKIYFFVIIITVLLLPFWLIRLLPIPFCLFPRPFRTDFHPPPNQRRWGPFFYAVFFASHVNTFSKRKNAGCICTGAGLRSGALEKFWWFKFGGFRREGTLGRYTDRKAEECIRVFALIRLQGWRQEMVDLTSAAEILNLMFLSRPVREKQKKNRNLLPRPLLKICTHDSIPFSYDELRYLKFSNPWNSLSAYIHTYIHTYRQHTIIWRKLKIPAKKRKEMKLRKVLGDATSSTGKILGKLCVKWLIPEDRLTR